MTKNSRRKHVSDKLANKSAVKQSVNRFELKFTKEKYQVLGRKRGKSEQGAPTLSKAKANEERLKTLGNQIRVFGKSNKFSDHRLGEKNAALSHEEKMVKRFALERQKRYGKKFAYRLDDEDVGGDDVLTHYGQSLSEIEQCVEKPLSDDDEAVDINIENNDATDGAGSRKSFIDEMVAKSKQFKHEKQVQRDQLQDLTEKLDQQWRTALNENLMGQLIEKSAESEKPNFGDDKKDYDILVRELFLDKKKASATNRLKTEEELAKEEIRKLEKLETERRRRMNDGDLSAKNFDYVNPDDDETNVVIENDRRKSRNEKYLNGANGNDDGSEEDGDSVAEEDFSDNEDLDTEEEGEHLANSEETDKRDKKEDKVCADIEDIPYVFAMPKSYSALKSLLFVRNFDQQCTIIERLTKCLHPSLKAGNKQRLQRLYLFLLRYFDEISVEKSSDSNLLAFLDKLCQFLFKLASYNGQQAGKCAKVLLKKHCKEFATKFHRKRFPDFNVFAFFGLVPKLFSCSDFWHPIATPCMLLMSDLLDKCRLKTTNDMVKGLLLCLSVENFVKNSKRYVPSVVAFLRKVVEQLGAKSNFSVEQSDAVLPFSIGRLFSDEEYEINFSSVLYCCVKIARQFFSLWSNLPSSIEAFEFLTKLPTTAFPDDLKKEFDEFCIEFNRRKVSAKKTYLKFLPKPEKEMQFLEPRIETNFNPERKHRKSGKDNDDLQDRQRLLHKYKREYKSAARELRRDNEFLSRHQYQERAKVDRERTEKTKRLMSSLMGQEADYKKLKRMKKD